MSSLRRLTLVLLFGSFFALGCGDDATAAKPTCEEIVEACHPVDPGTGAIHECHENAEAATTTEAMCQADRTNCLAICAAAAVDSGTVDSGASDSGASDSGGALDAR